MSPMSLSADLLRREFDLGSATLHEAAGKHGAPPSAIKPLRPDWRVAAPVLRRDADELAIVERLSRGERTLDIHRLPGA